MSILLALISFFSIILVAFWCYFSFRWPFLMAIRHKKDTAFWRDFGKLNLINFTVFSGLFFIIWLLLNIFVFHETTELRAWVLFLTLLGFGIFPIMLFPAGLFFIKGLVKALPGLFSVDVLIILGILLVFGLIHLISSEIYAFIRRRRKHPPLNRKSVLAYLLYILYWVLGALGLFCSISA